MIAPLNTRTPIRQTIEKVVAGAGGLVGGLTAAVPAAVVGGLYAAESGLPVEQRHTRELGALLQAGMSVVSSAAQQGAGQWLLGLPGQSLSLSNWSSALAGSAWQYYGGGCGNIAEDVFTAVDRSLADQSNSLARLGQGLVQGLVAGARGGAYEGRMQGLGLVDGLVEGGREARALLQAPTLPQHPPLSQASSLGSCLISGAGVLGATLGAALGALDGAVEGGARGLKGQPNVSNPARRWQVSLSAAVGGALLFGPAGAACGALLGQWASAMPKNSELDRILSQSLANNSDLGDSQANTYRNAVEGGLVGCLAGARSGMTLGKQNAQNIASQLWEQITAHTNEEKKP